MYAREIGHIPPAMRSTPTWQGMPCALGPRKYCETLCVVVLAVVATSRPSIARWSVSTLISAPFSWLTMLGSSAADDRKPCLRDGLVGGQPQVTRSSFAAGSGSSCREMTVARSSPLPLFAIHKARYDPPKTRHNNNLSVLTPDTRRQQRCECAQWHDAMISHLSIIRGSTFSARAIRKKPRDEQWNLECESCIGESMGIASAHRV